MISEDFGGLIIRVISAVEIILLNLTKSLYYFSNNSHVFRRIKNPNISSMHETPKKFIPSLVAIGHVISEEKIFEKNNIKDSKQTSKKGNDFKTAS